MKLLVTLDGSHFSETILATVAALARPAHAAVELVAVGRPHDVRETAVRAPVMETASVAGPSGRPADTPLPHELLPRPAESRDQAIQRLGRLLREYLDRCARASLPDIDVRLCVLLDDDVAEAIIDHARREHPDAIAMATHGRSGLSHLLAGSVCERVIRSGVAPVLVVRPPG